MEIVKGSLQSCTQRNWMGETGQMENNTKPHKIIWDISHIIKARENSFKFFQRNIYTAKQPSDCNYHFHSFLSPHSFLLILYTYGICIFHAKCSLLLLLHISKYFSHTFSVCGKSIFLCVCICLYSWKSVGNISAAVKYWEHKFEISHCVWPNHPSDFSILVKHKKPHMGARRGKIIRSMKFKYVCSVYCIVSNALLGQTFSCWFSCCTLFFLYDHRNFFRCGV